MTSWQTTQGVRADVMNEWDNILKFDSSPRVIWFVRRWGVNISTHSLHLWHVLRFPVLTWYFDINKLDLILYQRAFGNGNVLNVINYLFGLICCCSSYFFFTPFIGVKRGYVIYLLVFNILGQTEGKGMLFFSIFSLFPYWTKRFWQSFQSNNIGIKDFLIML